MRSEKPIIYLVAFLSLAWVAGGCSQVEDPLPPKLAKGRILYTNCVACHKADGSGNARVGAPAIGGLTQWYVDAQLKKFQAGDRGAHPDDLSGMRMKPMALTLRNNEEIEAVAGFVASMDYAEGEPSLQGGDATKGKTIFATCAACHGQDGAGNKTLNAPPLHHADDWYLLEQLKKFKAGVRGANPKDITGAQMRPMAMTLTDEQAMKDVIAYIMTLSK